VKSTEGLTADREEYGVTVRWTLLGKSMGPFPAGDHARAVELGPFGADGNVTDGKGRQLVLRCFCGAKGDYGIPRYFCGAKWHGGQEPEGLHNRRRLVLRYFCGAKGDYGIPRYFCGAKGDYGIPRYFCGAKGDDEDAMKTTLPERSEEFAEQLADITNVICELVDEDLAIG
jgi:hypothetical protein